ncbi:MAG: hypothetical protein Q9221_006189 [Calogaya cf. arnoldii]
MTDSLPPLSEDCIQCSGTTICRKWTLEGKDKVKLEPNEATDLSTAPLSKPQIPSARQKEPFPFMKLPLELRYMVYKELLVMPCPITIYSPARHYHQTGHLAFVTRNDRHEEYCPLATCQILQVSKAVHAEAMPVYFGSNTFDLWDLDALSYFLSKLNPDSRRCITSVILSDYYGRHPARSMKILRGCVSLRQLTLMFASGAFNYGNIPWHSVHGLKDLLQIRGIQCLKTNKPNTDWLWVGASTKWPELVKKLQVLKQPYSEAAIRRQDKKDYPPEKAKRTVFGRANVLTRAETRLARQSETKG